MSIAAPRGAVLPAPPRPGPAPRRAAPRCAALTRCADVGSRRFYARFVAFWTVSAAAGGGLLFAAFSLPFWSAGAVMARKAFQEIAEETTLTISPDTYSLKSVAAGRVMAAVSGETEDVEGARVVISGSVNDVPLTELELVLGADEMSLGAGLTTREKEWVRDCINEYLAAVDSADEALMLGESERESEL